MDSLNNAVLRSADGSEVLGQELWADKPCVVLVLRRPGCVLCRAEAQRLWQRRADMAGVNLVCVVHEWRAPEIKAFTTEGYWSGPLYHDISKAFYSYVGGGKLHMGSVKGLFNPFSSVWARIRAANKEVASHNVVGEGLIMGGLLVVAAGGKDVLFTHLETDLGVHADHEDVLKAVKKAVAMQQEQERQGRASHDRPASAANAGASAVMAQ